MLVFLCMLVTKALWLKFKIGHLYKTPTFALMKYLFVLAFGVLVLACSQQCEKPTSSSATGNPADSELTLYMRHLEKQAQAWRDTVANGGTLALQPEMLDSLFTATPTDGKIGDSILFSNFGNLFKQEVMKLSTSAPQDLSSHYNLMVTACVNCHRHFCPGPIKRIEKLRVSERG